MEFENLKPYLPDRDGAHSLSQQEYCDLPANFKDSLLNDVGSCENRLRIISKLNSIYNAGQQAGNYFMFLFYFAHSISGILYYTEPVY